METVRRAKQSFGPALSRDTTRKANAGGLRKAFTASLDSFSKASKTLVSKFSSFAIGGKTKKNSKDTADTYIDESLNLKIKTLHPTVDERSMRVSSSLNALIIPQFSSQVHRLAISKSAKVVIPTGDSSKTLVYDNVFKDEKERYKKQLPLPPLPTREAESSVDEDVDEDEARDSALAQLLGGTANLSNAFSDNYKLKDLLGDGAFGFVFTAERFKDGLEVACKFIIRSKISKKCWVDCDGEQIPFEISVLKSLSHPNIITYIEHIMEKDYILLITELHGTSWDCTNTELDPIKHPYLKFKFREKVVGTEVGAISSRTSCDLFECIDARNSLANL